MEKIFVWSRKTTLYQKAPTDSKWYADRTCDAAVLGRFDDSLTSIHAVEIEDGDLVATYKQFRRKLKKEEQLHRNVIVRTALISEKDYMQLRDQAENADV